jgi:hypothetical protein
VTHRSIDRSNRSIESIDRSNRIDRPIESNRIESIDDAEPTRPTDVMDDDLHRARHRSIDRSILYGTILLSHHDHTVTRAHPTRTTDRARTRTRATPAARRVTPRRPTTEYDGCDLPNGFLRARLDDDARDERV